MGLRQRERAGKIIYLFITDFFKVFISVFVNGQLYAALALLSALYGGNAVAVVRDVDADGERQMDIRYAK